MQIITDQIFHDKSCGDRGHGIVLFVHVPCAPLSAQSEASWMQ